MKTRYFDSRSVFTCARANRAFWNGCIYQTIGFIRENARLVAVHGSNSIYPAMLRGYRATLCKQLEQRRARYYYNNSLDYS